MIAATLHLIASNQALHRLLIVLVDGKERRFGVERVEDGLDKHHVAPAVDQPFDLRPSGAVGDAKSRGVERSLEWSAAALGTQEGEWKEKKIQR